MLEEPASDREYGISELEEVSGIPRRTIHYYIARDLLPPAEGSGLGARYREVHVLRLKVIEILKKQGLKLDYIRAFLDSMTLDHLRGTYEEAEKHPSKMAYLLQRRIADRTLTEFLGAVGERTLEDAEAGLGKMEMMESERVQPESLGIRAAPEPSEVARRFRVASQEERHSAAQSAQHSLEDATTWRRMQVTPDLEIHYRPGRDSRFTTKLKTVVRMIRGLFAGEETASPAPAQPVAGAEETGDKETASEEAGKKKDAGKKNRKKNR